MDLMQGQDVQEMHGHLFCSEGIDGYRNPAFVRITPIDLDRRHRLDP